MLSLVSMGFGLLLMLEGGAGLKHEGVVYREVHDDSDTTRVSFRAYCRRTNGNPTLEHFLGVLQERYPNLAEASSS